MVDAGTLDQLFEVQAPAQSKDAEGAPTQAWNTFEQAWGSIEYMGGGEVERARAVDARVTAIVTLRWFPGLLKAKHRLRHEGSTFNLQSVVNVGNRDDVYRCQVSEDTDKST